MSYEFLTYEQKGRITYVTINRPERLNALHPPANAELYQAFTRFNDDPDAWIAVPIVGPNLAAITQYLNPVFAISLAALILGETVETFHLAGIAAILAGIYLSSSRRQRSTRGK